VNLIEVQCVSAAVCAVLFATTASAQELKMRKGPLGGTLAFGIAGVTDYSFRGISQTMRDPAIQLSFSDETPSLSNKVPVSAYAGVWGSNVNFPGTGARAEVDLQAGLRAKAIDDKLTFDLGYIRYNYIDANPAFQLNFNEFGLVVGYDFGVVALSGALRYSPNFFANSGIAWYKWLEAEVPLPFIRVHDNVSLKLFGTVGTQYVERNANYGIPDNNYWDWQLGLTATVYGFDLSVAYTDTNITSAGCGNTANCAARAIFTVAKTF
jgi:uncharacterized protein (TIGR02001 family)